MDQQDYLKVSLFYAISQVMGEFEIPMSYCNDDLRELCNTLSNEMIALKESDKA